MTNILLQCHCSFVRDDFLIICIMLIVVFTAPNSIWHKFASQIERIDVMLSC